MSRETQWNSKDIEEILAHFDEFHDLRTLEALLHEAPGALKDFMSATPKDPQAAIRAFAEVNRRKEDQLNAKLGLKPGTKASAKFGRRPAFDENGDTTRRVKEILRSK